MRPTSELVNDLHAGELQLAGGLAHGQRRDARHDEVSRTPLHVVTGGTAANGAVQRWRAVAGGNHHRARQFDAQGFQHQLTQPTQDYRIPDSVIRVMRHKGKIGKDIDHPAVFPVTLPVEVIEAYTDEGVIVFEPFGGSGTTLMAAQRTGRIGRAVEIAPEYVDVALLRFQQNFPGVPVTLAATGEVFEVVDEQRKVERRQESEHATV